MTADVYYHNGDNVFDDDTGNYSEITSALPKVERMLSSHYRVIDGVPFGHKGYTDPAISRGGDTPENRRRWARYTEECLGLLVADGLIRDLVVTVDDPLTGGGVGAIVSFYDVPAGGVATTSSVPPWGKS